MANPKDHRGLSQKTLKNLQVHAGHRIDSFKTLIIDEVHIFIHHWFRTQTQLLELSPAEEKLKRFLFLLSNN
jgi:hypothetical protein